MAITKLNSLAIPDDTIVEADLSYPLTNFSSTGIDDNASSTAVTIDGSGNVITGSATANASDAVTLRQDGTAHVNNAQFSNGNGTVGGTTPSIYSPASATLAISTNSTERLQVDGSGHLNLSATSKIHTTAGIHTNSDTEQLFLTNNDNEASTGVSIVQWGYQHSSTGFQGDIHYIVDSRGGSGKHRFYEYNGSGWTNLVSIDGAGVTFDSGGNYLDDYEEGTWTPSYSGSTLSGVSYINQYGFYTKTGNVVTATFRVVTTGTFTAGSSALSVAGLPFSAASSTGSEGTLSVHDATRWSSNPPIVGRVLKGTGAINIYYDFDAPGAGTDPLTVLESHMRNASGNNNTLQGTIVYRT